MNADDVFRYGHLTVLGAVDGFPDVHWETPGVCGVWSAKDVIAHLASYELATAEAFAGIQGEEPSETLGLLLSRGEAFNDSQVEQRRGQTANETLAEHTQAHDRAAEMLARIPLEQRRRGALRFVDDDELAEFLAGAGLVIEEQFGDWDRRPLTDASPEIITIARRR